MHLFERRTKPWSELCWNLSILLIVATIVREHNSFKCRLLLEILAIRHFQRVFYHA